VLPQAASRLDTRRELWPDEVRIRVQRLNLDAASFRQLERAHGGDGDRVRAAVLEIIEQRGKMQNPETGSGGMLVGTVEEVGPESALGLRVGDPVATLVSLTLTPLVIEDGLARWDGRSEQVPADGYAILFGRSIAARIPDDLPAELALAVMDVCGAPALTDRVVRSYTGAAVSQGAMGNRHFPHVATSGKHQEGDIPWETGQAEPPVVVVVGGAGKSGSLALAAARRAGATTIGVVPHEAERALLDDAGLADHVLLADARDPVGLRDAVTAVAPDRAHVTVVCVDVSGCEGGAILATRDGGTVIFFSMATSFSTAALSAEGLVADVTMLVGNGYLPGHADFALEVLRAEPAVRRLFERRL
jgi:L-erythro-3,5-diaminohexanoate dehydrogenase